MRDTLVIIGYSALCRWRAVTKMGTAGDKKIGRKKIPIKSPILKMQPIEIQLYMESVVMKNPTHNTSVTPLFSGIK